MSLECKPASWMKQGSMTLLRSSVDPWGFVSTFIGPLGPVLGVLLGSGLSLLCGMLGERFQVSFAPCAFERSPPTLILVPAFIQ